MIWFLILSSALGFIWHMPMLLLLLTPFALYKSSDKGEISSIQNKKPKSSMILRDKSFGYICGKWYFGLIHEDTPTGNGSTISSVWIICKPETWTKLTTDEVVKKQEQNIKLWELKGTYFNTTFTSRNFGVDKYLINNNNGETADELVKNGTNLQINNLAQKNIVEDICDNYKKNIKHISFIYGEPGSGKSTIGILVSKNLNGQLCLDWNPIRPGCMLTDLYKIVNPTKDSPLVILLDEIDILIGSFPVASHKHIPIQVQDKLSWNSLFDRIGMDIYPNLIIIMTSNKKIEDYEPSLLREGRVDKFYNI